MEKLIREDNLQFAYSKDFYAQTWRVRVHTINDGLLSSFPIRRWEASSEEEALDQIRMFSLGFGCTKE